MIFLTASGVATANKPRTKFPNTLYRRKEEWPTCEAVDDDVWLAAQAFHEWELSGTKGQQLLASNFIIERGKKLCTNTAQGKQNWSSK